MRRSREPSEARSRRSVSVASVNQDAATDQYDDLTQMRSAKRRRTTAFISGLEPVLEPVERDSSPDDLFEVQPEEDRLSNNNEESSEPPTFDEEKENQVPRGAKPATKKRKRKSIGQQSFRRKKRSSGDIAKAPAIELPMEEPRELATEEADDISKVEEEETNVSAIPSAHNSQHPEPTAPTMAKKKRHKRKSVTMPRRKRTSRGNRQQQTHQLTPEDDAESISDVESSINPPARRPQVSEPVSPPPTSPIPSAGREDSEDDYVDEEETPEPPTPAVVRTKGQSSRDKDINPSIDTQVKRSSSTVSKNGFPILTHRVTNIDSLPTIAEYGESDVDSEEEAAREKERRVTTVRAAPNTVEILAQYCREIVQTAVDRLDAGPANKAERKRKQTALEAVGRELDERLFTMSAAVENRIQLEARVRRAKRKKAELQARWLEIRRQREEVALKCDDIRQQNWEREKEREEKWHISEAAHRLELEMNRGEPEAEEDLEYLLMTVARDVGDIEPHGGMLERVKRFNGQLERVAGMLEGR